MASHLNATEFQIGSTQTITGIQTAVNNSNSEIPTSKAVRDFIDNTIPASLTVSGNWTNTQYISEAVDITGLIFTVTYKSGTTASVTPSVRPLVWSDTVGTQTAAFYYTENGVTVSASKSASVILPYPVSLTITGNWSNSQYAGKAVDYTGLTFTASYSNNTTATVSPSSYSPTTWGSTAGTQSCTFYYSENGVTVSASKSATVVEMPDYVGGKVFYIDSSSTNSYTFYDASGNQVSEPTVGTDCTNWTYKKTGSGKDKFYVYYTNYASLGSSFYWGYYGISTGITSSGAIGSGKTYTATVLSKTDTSGLHPTIWEKLVELRQSYLLSHDDWYIPCGEEGDYLGQYNRFIIMEEFWLAYEKNSNKAYLQDMLWTQENKNMTHYLVPVRSF